MLQLIRNLFRKQPTLPQTFDEMAAAGHYCRIDDIVKKHCPVKPERFTTTGLEVIHFKKKMTTVEVEAELDRRGLRPATIEELLAYGAKNLTEEWNYHIAALGSRIELGGRNSRFAPCLQGTRHQLVTLPAYPELTWESYSRFLAAPKA